VRLKEGKERGMKKSLEGHWAGEEVVLQLAKPVPLPV
jgi:hypothetical protein